MAFMGILIYLSIFMMYILPTVYGQNTGICDSLINCDARGQCISSGTSWYCKCDEGFATFPEPEESADVKVYCNYKQKDQLVAFLLSFFVGLFAAGRFYCHLWMSAGLKIGLNIGLGCFGMCIVSCITGVSIGNTSTGMGNSRRGDGCCAKCMAAIGCLYVCVVSLGIFAWLVTDWVLFGLNEIPDENGVPLAPW